MKAKIVRRRKMGDKVFDAYEATLTVRIVVAWVILLVTLFCISWGVAALFDIGRFFVHSK